VISFVFPAYNEAPNLARFPAELFPVLRRLNRPFEVLVVDDGSTDETARVVQSLAGSEPRLRLVRHARNRGLGAAIKTGIRESAGDLIVTMDSDLTFAPSLIPALLARFEAGGADVVIGSPALAGFDRAIPRYRVAMSRAATAAYSLALGQRITAVSPIFRLYRSEQVKALTLSTDGFDINAEILFKLLQQRRRVAEIPAALTTRVHGTSKLNYSKEVRRHLRLLASMVLWRVEALATSSS
jgi:dolichol-phosphate mannosyltransferase